MGTIMLRGALATALLLTMAATPAIAQSLIRGTVVDADKKPVEGATITFVRTDDQSKRQTKSDRRGQFLFQGLSSGEYSIEASKEGLLSDTVKTMVSQGKLDLSFTLRAPVPAAGAPAQPGAALLGASAAAGAKEKETAALQALAASAMESVREQRHEEAITRLTELVGKMPTCADCYMHLGTSYLALKKYDDAEAALKKSVETRPTVEGYTALTRLYNAQKKFDLAAETSNKAIELSSAPPPGAAPAPGAPGAPAAGGAPGAPGAVAAAPSGPGSETLYNQGVVLWNAGKYAEAKTAFEASVKANPNNADAQYQLGMANLNLGQLPAARAAFEAYLKAAPDGARAKEVKDFLGQLPK